MGSRNGEREGEDRRTEPAPTRRRIRRPSCSRRLRPPIRAFPIALTIQRVTGAPAAGDWPGAAPAVELLRRPAAAAGWDSPDHRAAPAARAAWADREVQRRGAGPAGVPPRCSRSDQHASGQADRRVAAGPLAGVAPGRRSGHFPQSRNPLLKSEPAQVDQYTVPRRMALWAIRRAPASEAGGRSSCRAADGREAGSPGGSPSPRLLFRDRLYGRS